MAKGKQAAAAANKRYEAAIEHIDRLTTELVEAKERARRNQADAERLGPALVEVERLRAQVAAGTSDELESVRRSMEQRESEAQDRFDALVDVLQSIVRGAYETLPPGTPFIPAEAMTACADLRIDPVPDMARNRAVRRARLNGRTILHQGGTNIQDNLTDRFAMADYRQCAPGDVPPVGSQPT